MRFGHDKNRWGRAPLWTLTIIAVLATLQWGCSGDSSPPPPTGNTEAVSVPDKPTGPDVVSPNVQEMYISGGATSSASHPVEYRYDFDAEGVSDVTAWSTDSLASKTWLSVGLKVVKTQARCEIHNDIVSEWSEGTTVEVGAGPETVITSAVNTYYIGADEFTRVLNLTDGLADTVPYGSWITLYYEGIPSPQAAAVCPDTTNKCLRYQINYTWTSDRITGTDNTIAWRPFDPEDSNLFGVLDSTSMNVGSLEYAIRTRSVDQFDRSDLTPPEIEIIGNLDPTLDDFSLENYDGSAIGDGDTISWDWWNPANFRGQPGDTIDFSDPTNPEVVKEFYFVVKATGHDHPWENLDSGVKSWRYTFERVGSIPPIFEVFARSSGESMDFVSGLVLDELSDTARVTFRYHLVNDPGGTSILNNLPDFLDRDYEYAVMGRDLSLADTFDQYVYFLGGKQLINSFNSGEFGRWTQEGRQRFFLQLKR